MSVNKLQRTLDLLSNEGCFDFVELSVSSNAVEFSSDYGGGICYVDQGKVLMHDSFFKDEEGEEATKYQIMLNKKLNEIKDER